MSLGVGGSSAGNSDGGIGDNDVAPIPSPNLLKDPSSSAKLNCRRIDPVTKDYVFGTTGKLLGMTSNQQKVQLALTTIVNSSVVNGLGQDFSLIQKITGNFQQDVSERVTRALSNLINTGQIDLISVTTIRVTSTGEFARIRWRDRSTLEEHTSTV